MPITRKRRAETIADNSPDRSVKRQSARVKNNNVKYTLPSIEGYNEADISRKNKEKSNFDPKNTGKSLSEALLFAEHWENMLCTKIVLNVRNNFCTQHFIYWTCNSMNNLSSYCGLVDAKIRASD